jgi:hypothetical protein
MREREPEAVALEDTEADMENADSVESEIDARLDGLDPDAREVAMRRAIAAYAETSPEILDALDDAATELKLSWSCRTCGRSC